MVGSCASMAGKKKWWVLLSTTAQCSYNPDYNTAYAIYFMYRYFRDIGLGGEIRDGLISQIL